MLQENPTWGSDRVVGALSNLGIRLSDTTIDNIRMRNGIGPGPTRQNRTNWDAFLNARWNGLLAADFFTTEVLCLKGLVRFYTLFVIDLSTRCVHVCGSTVALDSVWMNQMARMLTDALDGFCLGKTHLIIDRDTKYTESFKQMLKSFGIESVLCPVRAPKCNAFAERFVRSIKHECLNRLVPLGEHHLRLAIREYLERYNTERNHQGIENRLISGADPLPYGQIDTNHRLGGMLNFYYRKAA
jgi:transposase InsO family protein